jgi:hypothetical protein
VYFNNDEDCLELLPGDVEVQYEMAGNVHKLIVRFKDGGSATVLIPAYR